MTSHIWEMETARLSEAVLERLPGAPDGRLTCSELLAADLPAFVRDYVVVQARLRARIDVRWVPEDADRFRLDSERVRDAQSELEEALVAETLFTLEEIHEMVARAVRLQLELIVRPRQAFLHLLFGGRKEPTVEDATVILGGFGEHRPFVGRLLGRLPEADTELNHQEVDRLARLSEAEIFQAAPITALVQDFQLFLEFEGEATGEERESIRWLVLAGMLRERGLNSLVDALNMESREKEAWDLEELEQTLERHILLGALKYEPAQVDDEEDAGEEPLDLDWLRRSMPVRQAVWKRVRAEGEAEHLRFHFVETSEKDKDQGEG